MAEPLLNADEAAERLQLKKAYVYKLVRDGEIPHIRFGRSVRFRPESLDRWELEIEQGAGAGDVFATPGSRRRRGA